MLHLSILDEKRQRLLPLIAAVGDSFYLAGGTALALQIGHRDSIDFDFFINSDIDTQKLWSKIEVIFSDYLRKKTQEEPNTLSCIIDNDIRLSFFGYHYQLIQPIICEGGFNLASILDIGCMKLSAITSRATLKDYVDLYFILKRVSLAELLALCTIKYPTLDQALILKSLVYFEDITAEPISFVAGFEVSLLEIKDYLVATVKEYWDK